MERESMTSLTMQEEGKEVPQSVVVGGGEDEVNKGEEEEEEEEDFY